jgi:F-type H+-transporting ATPase subunit beta
MANIGKITQVIGSTFDAEFSESAMPAIYNAVTAEIDAGGQQRTLFGEISKHLGGGRVRCVALGSTEGLRRGADCVDTGAPVSVPVGEETLGRVFNMLGETVDGRGPVGTEERRSIHRAAPGIDELSTST